MGRMKKFPLWFGFVVFLSFATVEAEFFSDISNEEFKKLQQIASFLQKRVEEVYQPSAASETDVLREPSRTNQAPPFEFNLEEKNPRSDDSSVFAVRPSDPRYFQGFQNVLGTNTVRSSSRGETEKVKHPEVTSESFDFFGGNDVGGDFSMGSDVQQVPITSISEEERRADIYFAAIVVGCSTAAVVATIAIGISCYRLHKNAKAAANVDYPAYGVTGPNKDISPSSGDRRLAQSAQMYHYQHQKQQIIAMESMNNKDRRGWISDAESEDENEEGDYTVYECPGLAPTGEMEVKNPLFNDDRTPSNNTKPGMDEESQELPK